MGGHHSHRHSHSAGHDHGHPRSHGHDHGGDRGAPALGGTGLVNLGWALAQAVAGVALGSAALLSDSVHNLGDAAGLVLAWGAAVLAARKATSLRTWGWHRAEQLAGFANAVLVIAGAMAVAVGSVWKLLHPTPLEGLAISAWALGGILVNSLSAWWLSRHTGNLNAKGAFLHLVSDAVLSAAVVVGGLAVHFTGWAWIDPALALGVSAWLAISTWPFLQATLAALLDAVPAPHDTRNLQDALSRIEGVEAVHDLHLWPLGGDGAALSAHLVHSDAASSSEILRLALDLIHHDHPGLHATFQVEPQGVDHWHGHAVCPGRE
ncbi:MAG: cation transporter [Fibrobacteria bacterium]|nr:cation transporter [Fibrobacteria bacterium]